MSSLVAFPFKIERPEVVIRNLRIAAGHPAVAEVLAVAFEEEDTYRAIEEAAPAILEETDSPVRLLVQRRIGSRRGGKGDAMNTAIDHFLDSGLERLHFYDADISSFDESWVSRAEQAADLDYEVVRHYFPRASTDAMITWMVTRIGFALLFPRSELAWIEQPLGGELLVTRDVAGMLAKDPAVRARSDWGIDTAITFSVVSHGARLFEVYMPQGKAHNLYGRLTDLRTMLVECFDAVQTLQGTPLDRNITHHIEYPDVVPQSIAEKLGYTIESSAYTLSERWTDRQAELLEAFPVPVRDGMLASRQRPTWEFMTEGMWFDSYEVLLDRFQMGDEDWEDLLFHLWVARVLAYTTTIAIRGYSAAIRYLHGMAFRALFRGVARTPLSR